MEPGAVFGLLVDALVAADLVEEQKIEVDSASLSGQLPEAGWGLAVGQEAALAGALGSGPEPEPSSGDWDR